MWQYISHSTLKREAASVVMIWYLAVTTKVLWSAPPEIQLQIVQMHTLPIGIIFAGAFGLDWISKQTNIAGPPTSSTPTP